MFCRKKWKNHLRARDLWQINNFGNDTKVGKKIGEVEKAKKGGGWKEIRKTLGSTFFERSRSFIKTKN